MYSTCIYDYLALELYLSDYTSSETASLLKASLNHLDEDTAFLVNMIAFLSEGNLNGIIQTKRHQAILLALREESK